MIRLRGYLTIIQALVKAVRRRESHIRINHGNVSVIAVITQNSTGEIRNVVYILISKLQNFENRQRLVTQWISGSSRLEFPSSNFAGIEYVTQQCSIDCILNDWL